MTETAKLHQLIQTQAERVTALKAEVGVLTRLVERMGCGVPLAWDGYEGRFFPYTLAGQRAYEKSLQPAPIEAECVYAPGTVP